MVAVTTRMLPMLNGSLILCILWQTYESYRTVNTPCSTALTSGFPGLQEHFLSLLTRYNNVKSGTKLVYPDFVTRYPGYLPVAPNSQV
jgi:hypothetical protein